MSERKKLKVIDSMPTPSGTVTFLFTHIEGSTKLWEAHHEAMPGALARHDALVRRFVEAHHGQAFKTVGDAFGVALDCERSSEFEQLRSPVRKQQ
jgi:class 3 adenylate cyclase